MKKDVLMSWPNAVVTQTRNAGHTPRQNLRSATASRRVPYNVRLLLRSVSRRSNGTAKKTVANRDASVLKRAALISAVKTISTNAFRLKMSLKNVLASKTLVCHFMTACKRKKLKRSIKFMLTLTNWARNASRISRFWADAWKWLIRVFSKVFQMCAPRLQSKGSKINSLAGHLGVAPLKDSAKSAFSRHQFLFRFWSVFEPNGNKKWL